MIDQDYIENEINRLGIRDFDIVVSFVLNEIMERSVVNVNGKGDGGCDFRSFTPESDLCTACLYKNRYGAEIIQATIQSQCWQTKAIKDALKAKQNYKGMEFFWFFTSKTREGKALTDLEEEIKQQTGIFDVRCMDAKALAGHIFEVHKFPELMMRLGRPVHDNIVGRPERGLRFLHMFYAFHGTRDILRREMYDVAILSILLKGPKTKETLKAEAAKYLDRQDKENEIGNRIDALRVTDKIKDQDKALVLTPGCKAELDAAETCYVLGLNDLKVGVEEILLQHCPGVELNEEITCDLAFLLAKMFVNKESELINRKSRSRVIPFVDGEFNNLEINRFLVEHKVGKAGQIDQVREKLIDKASKNLLVQRLADAVAYAWMDYHPNPCSIIAMGNYDWTKLDIILDTNVTLPYLLAKLFSPTKDRYSDAIVTALDALIKKGCSIAVPDDYLGECAGHLWQAREFQYLVEGYEHVLKYAENVFVAHYCQMHEMKLEDCPATFEEYLALVFEKVWGGGSDWEMLRPSYIRNVKSNLMEIGILNFPDYRAEKDENLKQLLETEYSYQMLEQHREGTRGLINHDIRVLMHLINGTTTNTEVFVTIDKIVHKVFDKYPPEDNTRMLLMPDEFCDILKPTSGRVMSDEKLRAVAFTYAKVVDPNSLRMKVFFEEFARYSRLSEAQRKKKAVDLLHEYMQAQGDRNQSLDDETERMRARAFLKEHGIGQECDPEIEDSI